MDELRRLYELLDAGDYGEASSRALVLIAVRLTEIAAKQGCSIIDRAFITSSNPVGANHG